MDDEHYFKPQKKLIKFERHREPVERRYRVDGREITLLIHAKGKRTFESQCDIDSRNIDRPIPAPDPTVHYLALTRVKHDPAGQLEPGRFVRVEAFEDDTIYFGDTERLCFRPRSGESIPSGLNVLS